MKKIININLSGRVIPIEDSAYEKLQGYIESLRRYFANEEGRDEIINDIESRIAELMNEKVRKGASCVTEADINEIIASMGTPADFDAADAAEQAEPAQKKQQQEYSSKERKAKSRLYRDSNDKFIGGVCSGIAAYMNVDPAIVRILFAIITFGGFGLGFLLYILLWMILPTKDLDGYRGKRLYRNPEDRMIGGVAGGLAAYLGKEARVIRLIFAAPFLLSLLIGILKGFTWDYDFNLFSNLVFGSISSTFALVYIVLWMVLPEANTTYEKMEMRGEKVDVNSIRQNVQDGMDNVKDRVKGWSEEVKTSAQNLGNKAKDFANTRGKTFASEINETARRGGHGLGHAIGVLFKVFFLFVAGTIAFSLFVGFIAVLFGGIAWWPINNFLWTSKWQQLLGWGTLIFFLGVPLIAFITWLIRRILRVRSRNSYLGWTFGFLWTIGWVSAILLAASISKDFRDKESASSPVSITQPRNGKMIVAVNEREIEYNGNFFWMNDDRGIEGWDLSEDTMKLSAVDFAFHKSTDSMYHVNLIRNSCGRNEQDALNRANKIQYSVSSMDSILDLGSGFAIHRSSKYRFQHVTIEIYIPVGKKIRFDQSVRDKLHGIDIDWRVNRNWYRNNRSGYVRNSFYLRSDIDYIMDNDGDLNEDASGKPAIKKTKTNKENYRYDSDEEEQRKNDSIELQRSIEEKKQELKELEDRKNKKAEAATGKQEGMDDEDQSVASSRSSTGLSLLAWF